jgi:hypothetical protein
MDFLQLYYSSQSYNQEISRHQGRRHHQPEIGIEPSSPGAQAGTKTLQFRDCLHFNRKSWSQPHCFIIIN